MELQQHDIEHLLVQLDQRLHRPVRVLLVGGTILVHAGWRASTEDADLTFEADDPQLVAQAEEAVALLRRTHHLPIEIVSPALFLPLPPGWRERCRWIKRVGQLEVFYFDVVSTALAKIARAKARDQQDVIALVRLGEVHLADLDQAVEQLLTVLTANPGHHYTQPDRLQAHYQTLRPLLVAAHH